MNGYLYKALPYMYIHICIHTYMYIYVRLFQGNNVYNAVDSLNVLGCEKYTFLRSNSAEVQVIQQ